MRRRWSCLRSIRYGEPWSYPGVLCLLRPNAVTLVLWPTQLLQSATSPCDLATLIMKTKSSLVRAGSYICLMCLASLTWPRCDGNVDDTTGEQIIITYLRPSFTVCVCVCVCVCVRYCSTSDSPSWHFPERRRRRRSVSVCHVVCMWSICIFQSSRYMLVALS